MIRYELPFPPSVNNLFVNSPNGKGRFPSSSYKKWRKLAGEMILVQGRRQIRGMVNLSIGIVKPNNRKRDISNLIKAIEDILVDMSVIEDDSYVQKLSIQWVSDGPSCSVIIQQSEMELAA